MTLAQDQERRGKFTVGGKPGRAIYSSCCGAKRFRE